MPFKLINKSIRVFSVALIKTTAQLFFVLFLMLNALPSDSFAQKDNISVDETLAYINGKLNGNYVLKNKMGELEIKVFKDGKLSRVDYVALEDLNPENVYYSDDEKAIIVRCTGTNCVQRKTVMPVTKGQFSRINFVGEFDKKTQTGLFNAFEHLIRMFQDRKYKSNKPFEE